MKTRFVLLFTSLCLSACLGSEHQGDLDTGAAPDLSLSLDVGTEPDLNTAIDVPVVSDEGVDAGTDLAPSPDVSVSDLFTSVDVEPNPNNTLSALVHVVTSEAVAVRIRFANDEVGPFETSSTESGTEHDLVVVGMRANSTYTFDLIATVEGEDVAGTEVDFSTGDLPLLPPFEVTIHAPDLASDGFTFFGVGTDEKDPDPNVALFLAVDKEGEVVWYYNDVNTNHASHDREVRPMPDGSLMLSLKGGFRFVDLAGNTLNELTGGPSLGGPLHHDTVPLSNGNYLTFSTEEQTIDVLALGGSSAIKGDRILEMTPPTKVEWSWSAFDHMDTQRFPSQLSQKQHPKNGTYDWTHANGMQYLEQDDSVIVSFRHQHWVTKIDRATGEVLWNLGLDGDFSLTSGEWFFGQHAPELHDDNRILVFDNGNDRPSGPPYTSRGVMYQLDFDAMTAEEIWSYQMPDYGSFLGDIDLLDNGHVLITGGGVRVPGQPPQTGDSRIREVTGDDDPQLVWEIRAIGGTLYRATRIESFWP
jgi:hypothetical protein